ncbi:MAG: metallophosphoesterase family protein [bacterium]|nr:metallophosphoesterase family protein [bacterium]
MKIAVISDVHDAKKKLVSVLKSIKEQECDMIFALGDYTTLETFKLVALTGIQIYAVFGNMDEENDKIESWIRKSTKDINLRREMNRVQIEEENYALTHYPEIAEKLLKSGMYTLVLYGHTHTAKQEQDEETLMANPGAVKDGTFAIYDTKTKIFEVKSI